MIKKYTIPTVTASILLALMLISGNAFSANVKWTYGMMEFASLGKCNHYLDSKNNGTKFLCFKSRHGKYYKINAK